MSDEDIGHARSYVDTLQELVELEREEEMRRHEREIKTLSGPERENRGRALLRMRGRDEGEELSGHLVKFLREQNGRPLPDTEIRAGNLVMISKKDPLRDDNPTGTVTQVTNYSITVSFDPQSRELSRWIFGAGLRVDLYVNDITYQRMQSALGQLPTADGPLAHLRDVCIGAAAPVETEPVQIDAWHNPTLNDAQQRAVREALASEDVHLIHGPPGTGKTTTAIEVLLHCVDREESVLATAASNTAVDNVVARLAERGVDVVRLGHPARVDPLLHAHTLDVHLQDNETYQRSQDRRGEAFDVLDRQDELTYPSGRWRRGMSDRKIKELAEEERGARGVPDERIQEMAEWLECREQADSLFDEADRLERQAVDEVLSDADVVCSTNATSGGDRLENRVFDTLVMDEATQATAPSCWIPMTHARRAILVGDHKQLPPTVLSREASKAGLRYSLFERLARHHETDPEAPDGIRSRLRTQYRMNETIMGFSSSTFYDDRLAADENVRDQTLADLGVTRAFFPTDRRAILDPGAPLVFVDTGGIDAHETQRAGSHSRENPREAKIVTKLVTDLTEAGIAPNHIAVIAPYHDQVDRIHRQIDEDELEVDTVDGFQGREKEIVFVSLVRSNDRERIGFLNEPRRFNVAVTRARRKVVVIGDTDTVASGEVFDAFIRYVGRKGRVVEL